MERIDGEVVWEGKIGRVRVDRFRYDDGEEAEREIVEHPGAVGVVAHDGETLLLVRQPREPVSFATPHGAGADRVPFSSDAPFLGALGRLFMLGPGSIAHAHAADEQVTGRELVAAHAAYVAWVEECLR